MAKKKKATKNKHTPSRRTHAPKSGSRTDHARALLAQFKQFEHSLELGAPIGANEQHRLRPGLRPSDAFVQKAASAIDEFGPRLGYTPSDSTSLIDSIRYSSAMRQVSDGMDRGTAALDEKIYATMGEAGLLALEVYADIRNAIRKKKNADMTSLGGELKRLLKAGGTRAGTKPRLPRAKKPPLAVPPTTTVTQQTVTETRTEKKHP